MIDTDLRWQDLLQNKILSPQLVIKNTSQGYPDNYDILLENPPVTTRLSSSRESASLRTATTRVLKDC